MNRVGSDAASGNSPMWTGEWAITTGFTADDAFLTQWADAQKYIYSKGQGWIVSTSCALRELSADVRHHAVLELQD